MPRRDADFCLLSQYMPDSPALDEGARRYASAHIYSRPIARGPSVPKPANASSSNSTAESGNLSALSPTTSGAPPASPGGAETSEAAKAGGLSGGAENGSETTPIHSPDMSQDNDPNGPPSPAESGIDAVAHARHTPTPKLGANGGGGGGQSGQSDPYAMLGDSFGEGGGYEADHPKPRSGLDDLLM